MTTEGADEDDNFGTEASQQAILATLGLERRNRVLAGLYMGRSDTALLVRQASLHVWKVIVTHTPRMLREILPTLFGLLLGCLANQSSDKRQVRLTSEPSKEFSDWFQVSSACCVDCCLASRGVVLKRKWMTEWGDARHSTI